MPQLISVHFTALEILSPPPLWDAVHSTYLALVIAHYYGGLSILGGCAKAFRLNSHSAERH